MRTSRVTHASAQRLLEAARALHPSRISESAPWADLARFLNEADQTVNNWRSRGVPRSRIHDLSAALGCDWQWVLKGEGEMAACRPKGASSVEQSVEGYSPSVLHMALKCVRKLERGATARFSDEHFVRLTFFAAQWIARHGKDMTQVEAHRLDLALEMCVTSLTIPIEHS